MNAYWRRTARRGGSTLALCTLLALAAGNLSAASISIFGTGLDGSGNFLPVGAVDPNYKLIVGGTNAYVADGATMAEALMYSVPPGWPLGAPNYVSSSVAQWIGPAPNGDIVSIVGSGTYEYMTTFDLTGLDVSTAELSGRYSVDNFSGGILLNGQAVPGTSGTDIYSFQTLADFKITSGFVAGTNTLTFVVNNSPANNTYPNPNPTGLLVEITGTANPLSVSDVPEPALAWVVGAALGVIGILRRRK